jgi:hypothetical protein
MQVPEDWFELDLADEEIRFENWKYDVPPQECKIVGTPHFGQEVKDGEVVIHFKIKDCCIIKKATGEVVARLDATESGDE